MKHSLNCLFALFLLTARLNAYDEVVTTLYSKCPVTTDGQEGKLTISGDIIQEWEHIHTTSRGHRLRGSGAKIPHSQKSSCKAIPTNEFTCEVDLIFDYAADPTYSRIQFEFENDNGIFARTREKNKNLMAGSGTFDDRQLVEAFMGYHIMNKEMHTLNFELGRRRLFDLFDSKIEFESIFDGASLVYWRANEVWGSFQGTLAAFVVDQKANKFAFAAEVDFFNIRNSPIDLKYSLISWNRHGHNRFNTRYPLGTRFLTSQFLAYYALPELLSQDPSVYAAILHNHAATKNHLTKNKKAANAFYAGITLGQVKKKKDWSLDVNYQWVQAQAIPESDMAGMGRDNPSSISFYQYSWAASTNYKGAIATFIYGLTDSISLTVAYQHLLQENAAIGGKFRSSMLQVSTTYTF